MGIDKRNHGGHTRRLVPILAIPAVLVVVLWAPIPPGVSPGGVAGSAGAPAGAMQPGNFSNAPVDGGQRSTVTVAVDSNSTHLQTATKQAVAYWNSNGQQYLPSAVRIRYVRSEPADVVVNGTTDPLSCDGGTNGPVVGCACSGALSPPESETAIVEIRLGGPAAALRPTVTHELGHVLGLSHDDEPERLMRTDGGLTTQRLAEIEALSERRIEQGVRAAMPGGARDDPAVRSAAREHSKAMAERGFVKAEGWGIVAVDDRIDGDCSGGDDDRIRADVARTFAYRFVDVGSVGGRARPDDGTQTREQYSDSEGIWPMFLPPD